MSIRQDIEIPCAGESLVGWLYPANDVRNQKEKPALVLAHGLGGVKEDRLDAYAERFSQAGFLCVVFDYRYWGASTGAPRGLIDIESQIHDWNTAINYTANLPDVDATRVGIFGSSFSGGHAIRLAATNPLVSCAISQCPFTDGFASATTVGFRHMPKMAFLAIWDAFFSSHNRPIRIRLAAPPGEFAMMNSQDAWDGCRSLRPSNHEGEILDVPARIALYLPLYFPDSYAKQIKVPIMFAICGKDTVAPAGPSLRYARQAPKGVVKMYDDMGHFSIYTGAEFEVVMADYLAFLKTAL